MTTFSCWSKSHRASLEPLSIENSPSTTFQLSWVINPLTRGFLFLNRMGRILHFLHEIVLSFEYSMRMRLLNFKFSSSNNNISWFTLVKRSILKKSASTLNARMKATLEKTLILIISLLSKSWIDIKSLLNKMVLLTPESNKKLRATPLI